MYLFPIGILAVAILAGCAGGIRLEGDASENDAGQDVSDDVLDGHTTDILDDRTIEDRYDIDIAEVTPEISEINDGYEEEEVAADDAGEECERTCEPGPCSDILYVPEDYPTVEEAMRTARWGDIIQLASGTHYVEAPLVMNDCTHLYGEGGYVITSEIEASNPEESCIVIIGSNGCSIRGLDINPKFLPVPVPNTLCSTILIDNIAMSMDKINVGKIEVRGDATPHIVRLYTWKASYHDNAAGEITLFNQIHSLELYGNSHPQVRGTYFYTYAEYTAPGIQEGVRILENANPDLGTETNYGNNTFLNDSVHPEPDCSNLVHAYSISNQTPNVISAVGNQFEQEYEISSCGIYYGTYEDMIAHPDPYDPASDILTIEDNHDNPAYGIVDYSGFTPAP